MLSPEGRCKTLDASADGYVRAEACGTFILASHQQGDSPDNPSGFLALLAGTAVNQDGRSSSLTAPNGPAQQAVMRAALQDRAGLGSERGVAPADVCALSMHGTGESQKLAVITPLLAHALCCHSYTHHEPAYPVCT